MKINRIVDTNNFARFRYQLLFLAKVDVVEVRDCYYSSRDPVERAWH